MARETFIWDGDKVIPKPSDYVPQHRIYVIGDSLPSPLLHPATGKVTDSKSAFRRETKASGCVELGNDAPLTPKKPDIRIENSRETLSRVLQGFR